MKRREFIKLVGAAAWPLPLRAQQPMRRVAISMSAHENDSEQRRRLDSFVQRLQQLGWTPDRNVSVAIRWAGGSVERTREIAEEFVALSPDVIVVNGSPATAAMKRATQSIPIVFVVVNEPVAQGFVASVARPGANITGFTFIDFSVIGKTVQMLKALAPTLTRVALLFNPDAYPYYDGYLRTFQSEAQLPVQVTRAAVRTPAEIETVVAGVAAQEGGGVVVLADGGFTNTNNPAIRAALERYRLPHVVPFRRFVSEGALMSYGPDTADILSRAAEYVDRILKGANPAELPVQAPNKFELSINLKTAKLLGIEIPPSLLTLADEVIE
jgi:putative tryptophan/tyrosine transport system substrate-binding protein